MSGSRFTTEVSLGPPVVSWLAGEGHEVYQEVDVGRVADVVGVSGPLFVVVELKLALSFDLLDQAVSWRSLAHMVWVAVPHAKASNGRSMALRTFDRFGIGVIEVDPRADSSGVGLLRGIRHRPEFNRRALTQYLRPGLLEANRTLARAGVPAGGRTWTEFRLTCDRVRQYLKEHPGALLRDVVRDVEHHYHTDAGARASLVERIRRGVVPGVRAEGDGRDIRLFLGDSP